MLINKENMKVVRAYCRLRCSLWSEYIKCVDPNEELDITTKEIMRHSFMSGVTACMFDATITDSKHKKDDNKYTCKVCGKNVANDLWPLKDGMCIDCRNKPSREGIEDNE